MPTRLQFPSALSNASDEPLMELKALALIGAGALLGVLGGIWLLVRGWQVRWYWAFLMFFLPKVLAKQIVRRSGKLR